MSTTSLTRIADLVRQIEPLGRKETGMPISAADWNQLVAAILAILSIDRAQEESTQTLLEERFARKEHDHKGEVSIEWLDADLRGRVGDGAGELRNRIAAVEKKVADLTTRVARLEKNNDRFQIDIDKFSVLDVDRAQVVRGFEKRFSEVADATQRVKQLADDFAGIQANVASVADFRKSLVDAAGAPIDVAKIRTEVEDLKSLRENLKGADGRPLRVLDLELKVRELADIAGAGEGLEQRFSAFGTAVEGRVTEAMTTKISEIRAGLAAEQETKIRGFVKAGVEEAETRLGSAADTRIKAAETRLASDLSASLLAQVRRDQEPRNALIDQKLAEIEPRITGAVTGARAEIETAVRNTLTARLASDLQNGVAAVENRLTTRLTATERAFETFKNGVPATVAEAVRGETDDLRTTLAEQIRTDIGAARNDLQAQIPRSVQDATTRALAGLDTRIATTVTTQIGDLGGRIRNEVATATRDLPVRVENAVRAEVAALDVPGQIATVNKQTAQQLRTEISQLNAAERATTTTELGKLTLNMRKEIDAAVAVGRKAAVDEARTFFVNRPGGGLIVGGGGLVVDR